MSKKLILTSTTGSGHYPVLEKCDNHPFVTCLHEEIKMREASERHGEALAGCEYVNTVPACYYVDEWWRAWVLNTVRS